MEQTSPQRFGRPKINAQFDGRLGLKIRSERILRGISQQDLARAIDVTYQQIHKYEKGKNRVSIWHLFKIAKTLSLTIYELLSDVIAIDQELVQDAPSRFCLEHGKIFFRLTPDHQRAVHALAQTLSKL